MTINHIRKCAPILGALLLVPSLAHGQYLSPGSYLNPSTGHLFNNATSSLLDTMIQDKIREQVWKNYYREHGGNAKSPDNSKNTVQLPSHRPLSATDFTPARRGHPVADALIGSIKDDSHREQLATAVGKMLTQLAKDHPNNMATALAVTISLSRAVLDGTEMDDPAFECLRLSINDALAAAPTFRKLKASSKQDLYDYLVLNSTILAIAFEGGKTDPSARTSAIPLAKFMLEKLGQGQVGP